MYENMPIYKCKPIVDFFPSVKKVHLHDSKSPLLTLSNALQSKLLLPELNPQELDSVPESSFLPEPNNLQESNYPPNLNLSTKKHNLNSS